MQIRNILQYLEQSAARVPDKDAFGCEEYAYSFADVSKKSRAIGSCLAGKGYQKEGVVVFMEKSPKTLVAFLGCVYAGDFYVPIEEEMSVNRIEMIFENVKPRVMICDEKTKEMADSFAFAEGMEILLFDEIAETAIDQAALDVIRDRQIDTDPLYIVFTSGSTGVPKGVCACHRSVIDYAENLSEALGLNSESVFANQAPFYFDAYLKDMMPTLMFGASLYIVPKSYFMFPLKLVEFLNRFKVNTCCWVVSALTIISQFRTFDTIKPEYLHTVAFVGEVFPMKQLKIWREAMPQVKFTNLYGPTEVTGVCCYYHVDREFELNETVPIGRPFHNTEILLLNEKNELAAPGESGEICVRGTSLTLGYFHNFEKSAEAFVQNPLNDRYPELIYRTGDMGYINERGELEFASRKDFQIKHMGHRIELGEIETNVNMLEGVNSSCCVYVKEKDRIVLYYTGEIEKKELVNILRSKLPGYMIPNRTEQLEVMPLTGNGKMDRKALQAKAELGRKKQKEA